MAIRIAERQQSVAPIPGARVQNSADANAFGAPVFRATENLGEVLKRKAEDLEDADTLEAMNRFRQDVERHHNDPDKGLYNTRLGRDAEGLYADADKWMDNKAFEYAGKLRSTRASENFLKMAQQHWQQQNVANSRFEANQVRAYRDAEAKAAIDLGMNDIALNYADDAAVADAEVRMTMALELQTRGLGDDAKKLALQNMQSGIALTRFGKMLEADPEQAGAWLEANKDSMTAEAQSRAQSALTRTMEKVEAERRIYRTQEFVDGFVTEYGPGREQEGIAKIRETYSGEEEEKYITAYKTRVNEMKVKEGNVDAEVRKAQKANADQIYKDYYARGQIPPQGMLDEMLQRGELAPEGHRTMTGWNEVAATRSEITTRFTKSDPTWNNLTAEEQESKVMRAMGKTPEQRAAVLQRIKAGVLDGSITEAEIKAEYSNGNITKAEETYYTKLGTKIGQDQKEFNRQQTAALRGELKSTNIGTETSGIQAIALADFTARIDEIDPTDPKYREKVIAARREAFVTAVSEISQSMSNRAPTTSKERKKFQQQGIEFENRVSGVMSRIDEEASTAQGYQPEMYESNVDLTPREGEGPVYKKGPAAQSMAQQMVPQGKITGRFDDYRSYRKGQHNGIDIAAPEGTPITSPDLGVPLTVSTVRTGSKTAGNFVVLTGQLPNGDKVEMQVSHMANGSIPVKRGDTVNPGDVVGAVGNTGYTSDRSKGGKVTPWYEGKASGYHADVKIKVNGKYVNPEKLGTHRDEKPPLEDPTKGSAYFDPNVDPMTQLQPIGTHDPSNPGEIRTLEFRVGVDDQNPEAMQTLDLSTTGRPARTWTHDEALRKVGITPHNSRGPTIENASAQGNRRPTMDEIMAEPD